MTANTRQRTEELRAEALDLVTGEVQAELDSLDDLPRTVRLLELYRQFERAQGVSRPTARQHIARAIRIRRGQVVAERQRGGARPGAGAPPGNDNRWKARRAAVRCSRQRLGGGGNASAFRLRD